MKQGSKRNGFSLMDLLFVAIVTGIIAAISIPALLSSRRTSKESGAVATLRAIQSAQVLYRQKFGANTRFATFDQLRASGLLDESFAGAGVVKNNYVFETSLGAGAQSYCGKAAPVVANGAKYFGINQKGVVYQSNSAADIDCTAGVLTTTDKASPVY